MVKEEDARGRPIAEVLRVMIKSPCFDRDSLADAVEEWLGRDTVDGRVTRIQIRASQGLLSFSIELGAQTPTTREFPELPRDCVEQRSAIALSLALAIDALESDLPPALAEPPPSFQLNLHATATTGLPSALAVGGGLGFEWRPSPGLGLRLGIMGVTDTAEQRLQDELVFRYRTRLLTARADGCGRLDVGDWEAVACVGVMTGSLWTVSGGQFDGQTDAHGWYAGVASAELRLAGSRTVGLMLGVDLIVPLRAIRIAVRDGDDPDVLVAWRDFPSVIGALRLGPTLSF